jgi:endonuclease/exonuclease/phosphatase family metal-dependent hydrolase
VKPWRVVTWNVHGSANPEIGTLAETVTERAPDVLCIQEIRAYQARRLAKQLGWSHFWSRKHYPLTPVLWWLAEGLCVLTPHKLSEQRRLSLTPGTSSLSFRNRISQTVVLTRGLERLGVVNTHLASDSASLERLEQARRLASLVSAVDVLAGDLNAQEEPNVLAAFATIGLRDAWPPGNGAGFTSEAMAPRQRIDYVLIAAAATVTAAEVPSGGQHWARLSDHLPLMIEFMPAPNNGAAPSL